MRVKRYARYQWLRLIRIPATPEAIGRGMAIGVFAGMMPLFPGILAIFIAIPFRASKLAAAAGTLVSNPLSTVFLYMLSYRIGRSILPPALPPIIPEHLDLQTLFESGGPNALALVTGGFVMAVPSSAGAYFLTLRGVRLYRERRDRKRAEKARSSRANPPGLPPSDTAL